VGAVNRHPLIRRRRFPEVIRRSYQIDGEAAMTRVTEWKQGAKESGRALLSAR